MKQTLSAFILLLVVALTGAPLGMARMMGGHEAGATVHQHDQSQPRQAPDKSEPHAMVLVCAACVGVKSEITALPMRVPFADTIALAEFVAPEGLSAVPLLPPPQT